MTNVKKINDHEWEIEKTGNMNVPVKIFTDEQGIEKLKEDKSLDQGINSAHMPGIYKQFIMLPDTHQGYGFPVGGVAAFDLEKGCITPGGVGFDINCISGDSKIHFGLGYYKEIRDIEQEWNDSKIKCIEFNKNKETTTSVVNFMKFKPKNKVFKIKTYGGEELTVTEDHPMWTPDGMIEVKDLDNNSFVACYPFEGAKYEEVEDEIIVSEEDVLSVDFPCNNKIIVKELKKRGLLPLHKNSNKIPALTKLMAYNMGDGNMHFSGKKGVASFYGKKEDLELMRDDVESLGFTASKIYSRKRHHKIETKKGHVEFNVVEYHFKVRANSFVVILNLLGTPYGKKVLKKYYVPHWIMNSCLWHKRLFLASLFGAEMNLPATLTKHDYNFYMPCLSMSKSLDCVDNARSFLLQVRQLLSEFKITSTLSSTEEDYSTNTSENMVRLKLFINADNNNIIKLYKIVNFEYNIKKRHVANACIKYLQLKKQVIYERESAQKIAIQLHNAGNSLKEICSDICSNFINRRFIERSLYEGRKTTPRIASNFIKFGDYIKSACKGLGKSGMVWDKIKSIEEVEFNDFVYDFTVKNKNHNFIANSLVISNCGVRLLTTSLTKEQVQPKIKELLEQLFKDVPCGVGSESKIRIDDSEYDEVLNTGVKWALKKGYATQEDVDNCEENGHMKTADSSKVSPRARKRGRRQLGTLGAGNHFLEIQIVNEIYDESVANKFGITKKGQIVVMIHCGSRGLGHQVCSDYINAIEEKYPELMDKLPDKDLAYAPMESQLAKDYLGAMSAAANYGWCNRQLITHHVRESFKKVFGIDDMKLVYDVAHNIAKIEEHEIDGKVKKVIVHRKGATRAFGPGHSEIPPVYREVGQPILIPGSMGTSSYVLVGTDKAIKETFASTPHGAGRLMSRHEANKNFDSDEIKKDLEEHNIFVKCASRKGISDEAPGAYKDIDRVIKSTVNAGIGKLVARVTPFGVLKG